MKRNHNYLMCGLMGLMLSAPLHSIAADFANGIETTAQAKRTIASVAAINVESPVGTVPRLPFQVWVTYSDGTSEFRQTKWSNAPLATEQEQAKYPVGKEYQINGVITGDNTTANGFPIVANVKVVEGTYTTPSNKPVAEPLVTIV